MRSRFLIASLALLIAVVGSASGLELTNGRMRLVLFDSTDRFSAFYKSAAGEWTPLFYSQDPRTTVLEVKAGNTVYRMGDTSRFQGAVTKTPNGGQIAWTSSELGVSESFSFATSANASEADGVRITIQVTNLSSNPVKIGMRYLIDTYLGEQNRIEFMTPSQGSMTNETQFTGAQVPAYWISPNDSKMSVALEDVMRGAGVTPPDRVIFANWKRLNDSQWSYTYDPSRNFNLLPYSINDSAVALYYDPTDVEPGASRTVTMLLGQYSPGGWGAQPAQASTASSSAATPAVTQLLEQASSTPGTSQTSSAPSGGVSTTSPHAAINSDLKTVNGVLQQIQQMLASPGSVSQSDIDVLRQVLDKLNARKSQDEGRQ